MKRRPTSTKKNFIEINKKLDDSMRRSTIEEKRKYENKYAIADVVKSLGPKPRTETSGKKQRPEALSLTNLYKSYETREESPKKVSGSH